MMKTICFSFLLKDSEVSLTRPRTETKTGGGAGVRPLDSVQISQHQIQDLSETGLNCERNSEETRGDGGGKVGVL